MVIAFLLMQAPPGLAAWWDASWSYRLAFDATNPTGAMLTNQQFLIEIDGADLNTGYSWSPGGDDVRFVDAASGASVSYYIKSWDSGAETASILILVPSLNPGETRTIYLYYGNGAAASANDPVTVLTESGLRYHTRQSPINPASRSEAVAEFFSQDDSVAGYGCTTVTNFTNINNNNLFSPPSENSDIAFLSNHYFEVSAAEAGTWEFRFGGDYGLGGGMYLDGVPIEEAWNDDLWWSNNWNNTADTLEGSVTLTEGWHNLELIGFEDCCDGGTSVQYRSPSAPGTWKAWSTANIDIRSERCLADAAPLVPTAADVSTSTHVAVDSNGGSLISGDVIRYTITLTESGGVDADNVAVQLDIPAGMAGFTVVSAPAGSTDSSNPSGGGNGTGRLDISGITVPAGGSVTIVYEFTVGGVAGGTPIDVSANVDNPSGAASITLAANQMSVALPVAPLSDVIKNLYLLEDGDLSRNPPATDQTRVRLPENYYTLWRLTPALALPLTIDNSATDIRVSMLLRRVNSSQSRNLRFIVAGSSSGIIADEYFPGVTLTSSYQLRSFDVDVVGSPPSTLAAGEEILVYLIHYSGSETRVVDVKPSDGSTHSLVEFPTDTAINIENISFYDAAHPGGAAVSTVLPGSTIYVRSEVSDPFGAFDITGATIDIRDSTGATQVSGSAMTEITSGGWPTASNKLYEYAYTVPLSATGTWSVDIVADEGTEGTVQHAAGVNFQVSGGMALEIDALTSASTCFAQSVTVRVVDGGGATITSYTGTVDLTTTSNHGGWQTSGGGTLTDADTDDGAASYTFVGADMGEVDFSLANTRADDLRITASDTGNSLSVTSPVVEFRDNRLQIIENDSLDYDVIAGRNHGFQVQLWRRDSSSGNCAIATAYDGVYSLKAWLTRDAADPGGTAPGLVGDSALGTVPNSTPAANNIDLDFTAGVAPLMLTPPDVGKYSINLRDDSSGFAVDELGAPQTIDSAATSAPYIVRPFALAILATGNPAATTGSGPRYVAAGADFDVTVAGVLYDSADDDGSGGGVAGDGIADNLAGLAGNGVAPSFGSEGETVTLSSSLTSPSGGSHPGLAGGAALHSSFTSGQGTATYQYNEVGIITISGVITDGDYLGAGAVVTGRIATSSLPIGRFVPDHFTVTTALNGSLSNTCTSGATDFTYSGQDFGYLIPPAFTITPRDTTGAIALGNYQNAFAHLTANEVTVTFPSGDAGNALTVSTSTSTGTLVSNGNGTHTLTLDAADEFRYMRTASAQVAPFVAQLPIRVTAISETLDSAAGSGLPATANPTGNQLRYGRLNVRNEFGPETDLLAVYSVVEYYNGSGWSVNTADGCSDFSAAITTTPGSSPPGSLLNIPVGAGTTSLSVQGPVVAGDGGLLFSAPGASNTGEVAFSINMSALPWLQFDWDGDGSSDTQLDRAAIFGQYRGHDRLIFWREVRD